MSEPIVATTANFDQIVADAQGPVIVDFWAPWCGPCRQVAPVLDQMSEAHENLSIVKVNVDDEPDLAMKFRITSIPALKLFSNGEVVKEVVGAYPRAALEKQFADYLG
ncbi:thioredoxin [Pseudoclavibacter sp. AY1F1]|uniref:thioredoxin n=1 Tax=Pseudoclavibacter TaxID=255204 RepID=UPI000CE79BB3|nr:thioredoxin [Pseudoclavibacter sp. AY1F1]PPF45259.1 thioredoxin [Pseudoclavibacter sp. AY1F1]